MSRKLPPLNSLRAFEAAARHGSFSNAAEELCVTHGAVSRHVQQLEGWLGFQLWTQSVQAAGTTDVAAVRAALAGRSIRAPSGFDVFVDPENQHLHKPSIIGRMDEKNIIWPVWTSATVVAPEPWSQWLAKLVFKKAV